jgi:hypothetical protein
MIIDEREMRERETALIKELHKKYVKHTEIARCIFRERKIYKKESTLDECLRDVEDIILELYKRKD